MDKPPVELGGEELALESATGLIELTADVGELGIGRVELGNSGSEGGSITDSKRGAGANEGSAAGGGADGGDG